MEYVPETSVYYGKKLTRLIAREYVIEFDPETSVYYGICSRNVGVLR
jgi:hypothetical protein